MIWAPGLKGEDITDYHIDALARFVGPSTVLIQIDDALDPDDPWSRAAHQTLRALEETRDLAGKPLTIVKLPEPETVRSNAPDFVSSYINYYVCNGAAIAAQFGDSQADGLARETLADLYPGREIVMLDIDPIGESGGGIHCATQQQPAPRVFRRRHSPSGRARRSPSSARARRRTSRSRGWRWLPPRWRRARPAPPRARCRASCR